MSIYNVKFMTNPIVYSLSMLSYLPISICGTNMHCQMLDPQGLLLPNTVVVSILPNILIF